MGVASNGSVTVDGLLGCLHAACLGASDILHHGSVAYRAELSRRIDNICNGVGIPGTLHPVHNHCADGYLAVIRLVAAFCLDKGRQERNLIAVCLKGIPLLFRPLFS